MAGTTILERIEALALELPESVRVDIEAWDNAPTFRVRKKNFVFAGETTITVKLPKDEAQAVIASDPDAEPCGYGLGRHGWVTVTVSERDTAEQWQEIREWVRTSYTLVAPKKLAHQLLVEDGLVDTGR